MESPEHASLKLQAMAHLRHLGCCAIAMEVRCPISRYRVDVAGYFDRDPFSPNSVASQPRTVIIECKQSRVDFLRHAESALKLRELYKQLDSIRESIERHHITRLEPQLRIAGSSLFTQMEQWDLAASQHKSYRQIIRKLRLVSKRLHGHTKFFTIAHYRLADYLLIASPAGLLNEHEVPRGWGLLVAAAEGSQSLDSRFKVVPGRHPLLLECKQVHRTRLLRNIAAAASLAAYRSATRPGSASL